MDLNPLQEHRGDRPFPVSAFKGPRSAWKVYIDDFSNLTIMPEVLLEHVAGVTSASQRAARGIYQVVNVIRDEGKPKVSVNVTKELGYTFLGREGWLSVSNSRSLELFNPRFHIPSKRRSPMVVLQISSGKDAHALQARQARRRSGAGSRTSGSCTVTQSASGCDDAF